MSYGSSGPRKPPAFEVKHEDRTVWLGNLSPGTTHQHLLPVMNQVGWCKRVQITSRGSGFALFSSPQEAWAAIENLNGAFVMGSCIMVDAYGKKKTSKFMQPSWGQPGLWDAWQGKGMGKGMQYGMGKGGQGMDYGSYGMGMGKGMMGMDMAYGMGKGMGKGKGKAIMEFEVQHPEKTVWIGNIAPGTTHQDLLPVMKQVGNCRRVQVLKKGTGFAFFSTMEEAQAAISKLDGSMVNNSNITIDKYTIKTKRRS